MKIEYIGHIGPHVQIALWNNLMQRAWCEKHKVASTLHEKQWFVEKQLETQVITSTS